MRSAQAQAASRSQPRAGRGWLPAAPCTSPWRSQRKRLQILAVPTGCRASRAVLDYSNGPITEPLVKAARQHVVCEAHDQPTPPAPRHGLGLGHELPRQPVTTLGAIYPKRVDLATSAPGIAGSTRHDLPGVVTDEDPELFLITRADGGNGGGGEPVLQQGKITRIGFVLDDEVMRAAHGRSRGTDQVATICSSKVASSK